LIDRYDLSSLKWVDCGAAPLGGAVEQACADRQRSDAGRGWGMTEISGAGAVSRLAQPPVARSTMRA
jgi:long-subunit acyl-CoA synthetase (AMP-forming)